MASDSPELPRIVRGLQARRERHLRRPLVVRALVVIAGMALLAAGVVMLIFPGPAFVVIPLGLSLLALEFTWAERMLVVAAVKAQQASGKAKGPIARRLTIGGGTTAMALAGMLAFPGAL